MKSVEWIAGVIHGVLGYRKWKIHVMNSDGTDSQDNGVWYRLDCNIINGKVYWGGSFLGVISNFASEQFELCHLRYVILGFMKMLA